MSKHVLQSGMDAFPKKNILTPIGALSIGTLIVCVAGAVTVWPSTLAWVLIGMAIATLSVAIWGFIYFAIKDPDRLQTEDYRIQRAVVDRMPRIIDLAPNHVAPPGGKLIGPPTEEI